eukprot:scaffold185836_cov41-Prasinocladus_malaysianus.AAC.1
MAKWKLWPWSPSKRAGYIAVPLITPATSTYDDTHDNLSQQCALQHDYDATVVALHAKMRLHLERK